MAIVDQATSTIASGDRGSAPFDIEIFDSFASAEDVWRNIEARGTLTPYQRFDWLSGLHAAGADADARIAIAVIKRAGESLALLPLALVRRLSMTNARFLGTEQSNADWMIALPSFAPSASELTAIFNRIAEAVGGIDLLSIQNQPTQWAGTANPLLKLPHTPAASNFYLTSIAGVPKPFIETRLAAKSRSDLKRSRRRMGDAMGEVRLVRVNDADTLDRVHAEFLEQRRARFDEMGIDNVFEQPHFVRFFREAAIAGFGAERPAMLVHALMAGDAVVATVWGTLAHNHYSLYINSTTAGEGSQFRLMSILIADLMDELLDMGVTSFDMGLGDFSYKDRWTDPQTVFNSVVPLTAKGKLAAAMIARGTAIKRTIKQNPKLWEAASSVRRVLFRLSGRAKS